MLVPTSLGRIQRRREAVDPVNLPRSPPVEGLSAEEGVGTYHILQSDVGSDAAGRLHPFVANSVHANAHDTKR